MTKLKLNLKTKSEETKKGELIFKLLQLQSNLELLEDIIPKLLKNFNKVSDIGYSDIELFELKLLVKILDKNFFVDLKCEFDKITDTFDILTSEERSLDELRDEFSDVQTEFNDYINNIDSENLDKKFEENIGYIKDRINEILMKAE